MWQTHAKLGSALECRGDGARSTDSLNSDACGAMTRERHVRAPFEGKPREGKARRRRSSGSSRSTARQAFLLLQKEKASTRMLARMEKSAARAAGGARGCEAAPAARE